MVILRRIKEMTMATTTPMYVSSGEFEKFVNLGRVFDQLSAHDLEGAGISHSNSFILFSSLRSLGLYDADGRLLHRNDIEGIRSKDKKVKQEAYKRIVNRAYKELLETHPPESITQDQAKTYFEERGAANSVSIKAARLYIWLLEQAGIRNPETVAIKTIKPVVKQESFDIFNKPSAQEVSNKQMLLNVLFEVIRSFLSTGGSPADLIPLVQQSRELIKEIDEENARNHARERR
jgi:hypothetical protein